MWAIILCCILIMLFYARHTTYSLERKMLTGFWAPDDHFKESAGVDQMVFWFGNEVKSAIDGYLVLVVDGKDAHNDKVKMDYSPNLFSSGGTLTLDTAIHNIPKILKAEFNIPNGELLLSDKGTLYARLYRENKESLLGVLDAVPDKETLEPPAK